MTSVRPVNDNTVSNAAITTANGLTSRPGQQLLPNYAIKLLKSIKISYGSDRSMNGVDVDPSLALINHILDCCGVLREVNRVYRGKGSLASRSVGSRVLYGFTAELGNLLLDAITFNPPPGELREACSLYISIGNSILGTFPEIAAQVTKQSGKMLIHHTALKASPIMAIDAMKMVLKAYPAGAWTVDSSGALPIHWVTHNPSCTAELITLLVNANPKGPWVPDNFGYLPIHWSVNQPNPSLEVVNTLLTINPSGASKPCKRGTLPIHWIANRDNPPLDICKALLSIYPDGARTFDDDGCLPLHRLVSRNQVNHEVLKTLIDIYPQALQCPNADGQLPAHIHCDQAEPEVATLDILLSNYPQALQSEDDEGYLPIHIVLDCFNPRVDIGKYLIKQFPSCAYHKTKDGMLPLHCVVSSSHPSIELLKQLLLIYPLAAEEVAFDIIPVDESADIDTWQGEWKKVRWTPLSRAIERKLDPIVSLFKTAILANRTEDDDYSVPKALPNHPTDNIPAKKEVSAVTSKTNKQQSNPPINTPIKSNQTTTETIVTMIDDEKNHDDNPAVSTPFRQIDKLLGKQLDKEEKSSKKVDRQADKQSDRQTDRQSDRKADRQVETDGTDLRSLMSKFAQYDIPSPSSIASPSKRSNRGRKDKANRSFRSEVSDEVSTDQSNSHPIDSNLNSLLTLVEGDVSSQDPEVGKSSNSHSTRRRKHRSRTKERESDTEGEVSEDGSRHRHHHHRHSSSQSSHRHKKRSDKPSNSSSSTSTINYLHTKYPENSDNDVQLKELDEEEEEDSVEIRVKPKKKSIDNKLFTPVDNKLDSNTDNKTMQEVIPPHSAPNQPVTLGPPAFLARRMSVEKLDVSPNKSKPLEPPPKAMVSAMTAATGLLIRQKSISNSIDNRRLSNDKVAIDILNEKTLTNNAMSNNTLNKFDEIV